MNIDIKSERNIDEVVSFLGEHFKVALDEIANEVSRKAQSRAPRKTGDLARSIGVEPAREDKSLDEGAREAWVAEVFANAQHAASMEYGSGRRGEPFHPPPSGWPPLIPPGKRAFEDYYNAYYHFRIDIPKHGGKYKGMHPGVKPQPFMRPAIIEVCLTGRHSQRIFNNAFEQAFRNSRASRSDGKQSAGPVAGHGTSTYAP